MPRRVPGALLPALLLLLAAQAAAQDKPGLGKMWTFEDPPYEYWQAVYGFSPDQPWLDHARLASLRFGGGCSASFVSPRGLILTNHHCARDYIAAVSPKDQDWLRDGFAARSLAEEVPVPGLTVQQLVGMRDVTADMDRDVALGDDDRTVEATRKRNEARILEEAKAANPDLSHQIVRLYQGAVVQLYSYRIFDDIRLCAAPELQIAHFGGDPDNFTYPRYSIDFALLRAYVGGKPADTSAHHFRWSPTGPVEGELVFVTGNPGSTDRSRTLAQLRYYREALYPIRMEMIDNRLEILRRHAAMDEGTARAIKPEILRLENSQKAFRGYWSGLIDPGMLAEKERDEKDLRERIAADPRLHAEFGTAFERLEEISEARIRIEAPARFHSVQGSRVLHLAVLLVRATDPSSPEDLRKRMRDQIEGFDLAEPPHEVDAYIDHLERARRWLPAGDPFLAAFGPGPMEASYRALLAETGLKDLDAAKSLLAEGADAVASSGDPALRVARVLSPLMARAAAEVSRLTAEENAQGVKIGRALFAVYGRRIAPDATFTLRIADGVVKGYPCNGTVAPWRTSFYGLFGRSHEFGNSHPFDLPAAWQTRRDRIDLGRFVNFVHTNDIIGGNSGSPVINRQLEIVGLVFDGNIESLPNRFRLREDVPRSVSVHPEAIIEALTRVLDASGLAAELQGQGGYD
jgi:hypothetical protein